MNLEAVDQLITELTPIVNNCKTYTLEVHFNLTSNGYLNTITHLEAALPAQFLLIYLSFIQPQTTPRGLP